MSAFDVTVADGVFRIGLHGPMGLDMHRAFPAVLAEADESDAAVILLYGTGDDFLLAPGDDLIAAARHDRTAWRATMRHGAALVRALTETEKPVVAKANGDATGTGLTILLLADFAIAADTATFLDNHVRHGVAAGDGAAAIWPLLVGLRRAKELLMLGDPITAPEAAAAGLVNKAVPADTLDAHVENLLARLVALPPHALAYTRKALNGWLGGGAGALLTGGLPLEGLSWFLGAESPVPHPHA